MKGKKIENPKHRMRIAIVVGIAIIGLVIVYFYYYDQITISGQRFGDGLSQIQDNLKNETLSFDSKFIQYQKGEITKDEILQISDKHISALNEILVKYNSLKPPETFASSLELFKLSTQSEIDSNKLLKEWIQTGDNSTKIRSDQLLTRAFEYEINALSSFNNAKENAK